VAALGAVATVLVAYGPWTSAGALTAREGGQHAAAPGTVWLCKPGQANDPCTISLSSTSVSANGTAAVSRAQPASSSKFDCFYVYPTVSTELTANADLKVQPAEVAAAEDQASRFSQVCDVWAPMYRQVTVSALFKKPTGHVDPGQIAYDSLLSGWKDFLAHDDNGRPIIFLGHSQGSAILIQLLRSQVDSNPKLRKLLVSAIILGGNVQVPLGRVVGGSFKHIPLCTSASQTGCVIAYSTFGTRPPPDSLFGRPGQGVSVQSGQTTSAGQQVACVNPVNFSRAPGALSPYFLSATSTVPGIKVTTPWVSYPGLYTGTCESAGGATWLQVTAASVPGDPRPRVTATLGPTWGYHLDDVNLALGDLVFDVALEEGAFH
jgi:hypothetical protein